MKRFIKLISVVLVLGAVATASTLGENPEVNINRSPTDVAGQHCDSLERLLGMCRSSQNFLQEN